MNTPVMRRRQPLLVQTALKAAEAHWFRLTVQRQILWVHAPLLQLIDTVVDASTEPAAKGRAPRDDA